MARRSRTDTSEHYTATVTVQMTPTDRAELGRRAAAASMRMSEFARAAMLGYELHVRDPLLDSAVRELAGIGNNLNQLAHVANATGQIDPEELRQALKLWREVVARLFQR